MTKNNHTLSPKAFALGIEPLLSVCFCRKLKKSCNDVTEGLGALSLEETSGATQSQKLSAVEQIFSFTSSHPTQFPQTHCQQFTQQLKDLPAGNSRAENDPMNGTVCDKYASVIKHL